MLTKTSLILLLLILFGIGYARGLPPAITQPIPIKQLNDFHQYPKVTQQLINRALRLSQLNLTYYYGSNNPQLGGMDCSGTINYLLRNSGIKDVPRSAEDIYQWAGQKGQLHIVHDENFQSPEFSSLKPGDLLFWSGTYHTKKAHAISHVMIYLGKNSNNEPLMFGASDGRTYQGRKMWGVSVFDFKLPRANATSKFVGYSCIPDLTCP